MPKEECVHRCGQLDVTVTPSNESVVKEVQSRIIASLTAYQMKIDGLLHELSSLLPSSPDYKSKAQEISEWCAQLFVAAVMLAGTEEQTAVPIPPTEAQTDTKLLERPISSLNLSIRARRRMVRGNISTIGMLVALSARELLHGRPDFNEKRKEQGIRTGEAINFGVTSLDEVREKLASLGLKLRDD